MLYTNVSYDILVGDYMKIILNSSKGFTLVELLAVILIIGILLTISVTAVMHYIDKAREEQLASQEKIVTMAAESYLQANRSQLPKSIGETTSVSLATLRTSKYLTEDIKNSDGESCMSESYVTVLKKTQKKYVYTASLHCGN